MLVGIGLIFYTLLTLLWVIAGDNVSGRVTRAWISTSRKGGSSHNIEFVYKPRLIERSGRTTVPREYFDRLPASIKTKEPGPSPLAWKDASDVLIPVRVLEFGALRRAAALPTPASIWKEAGAAIAICLFWNGIVSVFVYQLWIKPMRAHRPHRTDAT